MRARLHRVSPSRGQDWWPNLKGAALITAVMAYTDNVSATDAGNTSRRARILQYAQEVLEYVWNYRAWRFAYKTTTIPIWAGTEGVGILPPDFGQFGWKGGLFLSTGDLMEEEIDAQTLLGRYLRGERNTRDYALLGYDDTTYKPKIQTLQTSGTLTVLYCKHVPTLVDGSAAGDEIPIPHDYHNTVMVAGTVAKTRASKGDVRDFYSAFLSGLELMCRKEAPMQGTAPTLSLDRRGW